MTLIPAFESVTGIRLDPPLSHNFLIMMADTTSPGSFLTSGVASLLGDVLFGGFSECDGLKMLQEIETRHEGGLNNTEHRFPTRITWPNLVLTRGVSRISQSGWDWLYGFGDGRVRRMDGIVVLLDDRHLPHNVWKFRKGFPVRFDGPKLKAGASEVAVETLEIAHEGLWQLSILKLGAEAIGVSI
ncbi:MAG: phage tail protein [Actinomycetota bacterium]|nr:phage tail protein [Actinomycetota bacterium]